MLCTELIAEDILSSLKETGWPFIRSGLRVHFLSACALTRVHFPVETSTDIDSSISLNKLICIPALNHRTWRELSIAQTKLRSEFAVV